MNFAYSNSATMAGWWNGPLAAVAQVVIAVAVAALVGLAAANALARPENG